MGCVGEMPQGIRATQDAVQPVEALERERHFRADYGRPGRRVRRREYGNDRRHLLKAHRTASGLGVKKGGVAA